MSYALTCSSTEDYLRVRIDGTWPSEKPEGIISDIFNHWAKHHDIALFIDIRKMKGTPSVLGDYKEAEVFADTGFCQVGRIAVLDKLGRREADNFFEATAFNRGLQFKFFYGDEQEAIDWLEKKSKND